MYHIKPIISSNVHIELPTSMYQIKPISTDHLNDIHSNNLNVAGSNLADVSEKPNRDIVQQINKILKSKSGDMEELEARQEIILKQLKELKERLMSMHKELNVCSKPAQSRVQQSSQTKTAQKPIDASNLRDIVINANPSNVPFSLVILKKLWTDRLSINIQFYTHSSVSSLSQSAVNFQHICTAHQSTSATALNVSLIWKNVDSIEMINGSTLPIIGESNILRYLARIGPNEFNYETNGSNCNEIDSQLDLSEMLLAAETARDRQTIFKNLNATLGKNEYFGGSEPRINDLSLASAVLQSTAEKELPPTLLKWSRKVMG
ncbi:probable aminoacyl tRNA synthase complex-interacting multifunctional protein 2 isoform X2 [Bradysia coprophila]|uniref:probable aminoacyl tRNA synthase complex-interacting multifunctional protein 2 isoform X2 n=1 Tax=Bradysia coprophila TaxID=38358 RepID=UPI00187DCA3B|nr:probable aminoacyl tRNA synthase complex-interacting multifunctional protein 2 isoform X2 [Bradysia coprophila]